MIFVTTSRETSSSYETRVAIKESEIREVHVDSSQEEGITGISFYGYGDLDVEAVDADEAKRLFSLLTCKGAMLEGM